MAEKVLKFPHMKDIRDDHDMTQKDVAKLLNCSQAAYSYYEKGYRNIPTDSLIKLALYYDCSTDYLLGLTNERSSKPKKDKSHT